MTLNCHLSFRSTPLSPPNKVGLKCPSAHDGMQYDPIQGQGHEPLKFGNTAIFKGHPPPIYNGGWQMTRDS